VIQKHQLGTQMPVKRREESIPSLESDAHYVRAAQVQRWVHIEQLTTELIDQAGW
jgi:hypothetical protein